MYKAIVIIVVGLSLSISLWAQPVDDSQPQADTSDWSFTVGLPVLITPRYEGSDDYKVRSYPMVDISWKDKYYFTPRKGLGATVINEGPFSLDLAAGFTTGRDEDETHDLEGLGDVHAGMTANLYASYKIKRLSFNTQIEHQVTGEDTGSLIHLDAAYAMPLSKKLMMIPSLGTVYATDDYMDAYFSISPKQAAQSGYEEYTADAGFKKGSARLVFRYQLDKNWAINAMVGYSRLIGDAADSPVVKSKNQFMTSVGISYSF